jgi:hypothetical protein
VKRVGVERIGDERRGEGRRGEEKIMACTVLFLLGLWP